MPEESPHSGGRAVDRFDQRAAGELAGALTACLDVPRWVEQVLAGRPYGDVEALLAAARRAARPFTAAEVSRALAHHPRIGERARDDGPAAALSRQEQSGVDPSDADVAERLRTGNLAYEARFGQVFLVRAAGRSAAQILGLLEERLTRTAAEEQVVTAEELREIAVLRLRGVLAG